MVIKYGIITLFVYYSVFYLFFRHSQTQNTSFRALLAAENEYDHEVGNSGHENNFVSVENYGFNQSNGYKTKVSRNGKNRLNAE